MRAAHGDHGRLIAIGIVAVSIGRFGNGLVGIDHTLVADDRSCRRSRVHRHLERNGGGGAGIQAAYIHRQRIVAEATRRIAVQGTAARYILGIGGNGISKHHIGYRTGPGVLQGNGVLQRVTRIDNAVAVDIPTGDDKSYNLGGINYRAGCGCHRRTGGDLVIVQTTRSVLAIAAIVGIAVGTWQASPGHGKAVDLLNPYHGRCIDLRLVSDRPAAFGLRQAVVAQREFARSGVVGNKGRRWVYRIGDVGQTGGNDIHQHHVIGICCASRLVADVQGIGNDIAKRLRGWIDRLGHAQHRLSHCEGNALIAGRSGVMVEIDGLRRPIIVAYRHRRRTGRLTTVRNQQVVLIGGDISHAGVDFHFYVIVALISVSRVDHITQVEADGLAGTQSGVVRSVS